MIADPAFAASLHTSAITVTVFTAMLIVYLAWHRESPGLRWWAAANMMLALTLQLYALRADDWFGESTQSLPFVVCTIWLTGLLLTCAPLCIIAGVAETIELARFPRLPIAAAALQIASHSWLTFAAPSVAYRAIGLSAYLGFSFTFCAWLTLRHAGPDLRAASRIAAAAFGVLTLSYVVRISSVLSELAAGRPQSSIVAGSGSFSALSALNTLWTFAAMVMAEQKRRSREALQAEADRNLETRLREQRIRDELSRDLHDTLSGTVATISLLSVRKDGEHSAAVLGKIHSLAQNARKDVRMLLNKLAHPHSSERKWMAECREMAESITEAVGLQLDWSAEGRADRIIGEPMAALGLMRAVREALNNVARHSGASRVSVRCVAGATHLEVRVHDNGTGLLENHVRGHGLTNIGVRARELGGTVSVANNDGTEMRLTLPLPLTLRTGLTHDSQG